MRPYRMFGAPYFRQREDDPLDAIDEALAGIDLPATFGPDAAAPEPQSQDAAPPAPSASAGHSQEQSPSNLESEPAEHATPTEQTTEPQAEPDAAAHLTALQARIEAAEQRAREAEEAHQRAQREQAEREDEGRRQHNERLRAFALERVQARLASPEDLEAHEYRQLRGYEAQLTAQPHAERATRAEQELERICTWAAVKEIGAHFGLTADEQQAMARFPTPEAMEQYAQTVQATKAAAATEMADLKRQLSDLQLQVAAQGRRDSGADTTNSGTGHPPTTDLDSLTGEAWMDSWFEQTFGQTTPARQ